MPTVDCADPADHAFERYLGLWNATDDLQSQALANQTLTEDAAVVYPSFEAHGPADVVAVAQRFHQENPGVRIVFLRGVERHHTWVRGAWRVQKADGSSMRDGQTILELAEDGRVRRAIGFSDPLPERP